jgi:hypothetical protein
MVPTPFYVCRVVMVDGKPAWFPEDKAVSATDPSGALTAWTADGSVAPGSVLAVPVGQVTRATVSPGPGKVKLT